VDYHKDLLFTDLKAFNDKLFDWLLWYNTERPHHAWDSTPPHPLWHHLFHIHSAECIGRIDIETSAVRG